MVYNGDIRNHEEWIARTNMYEIRDAKMVAMFDEGIEMWDTGIWKVSISKESLRQ